MEFSNTTIHRLFNKLKSKACYSFNKNNFDNCLIYLKAASATAYYFYLGFKDDTIETLLRTISSKIIKKDFNETYIVNNCVFYDSFCLDNKGLTQQYIRAIINLGWNLLYITDSKQNNVSGKDIINEITRYKKSKIIFIPEKLNGIKRSQFIYDSIIQFNPSKLFMHLSPSAVYAITAFYALPKKIEKFQINLTDHTFWIGQGCLDYSLEFRSYGFSLSVNERQINQNNVFLLPYYPIENESKFEGFPNDFSNKTIILSGGAYYKIIDDDNTFFKLMKIVLEISNDVVILFAGSGDSSLFEKFILENNYQDRVFLIGYRKDINELFKHSDIFLNTYPYIGGLMCQYAASNSIPILSLTTIGLSKAEEVVCQKEYLKISCDNLECFKEEAFNLVVNKKYRIDKGKMLKDCMINEKDFNTYFYETIIKRKNQIKISVFGKETLVKDNDIESKIQYEKKTNEFMFLILSYLKFKIIYINIWFLTDLFIILVKKRQIFKYIRKYTLSKI
ncbi:MAG: glycosyltransferase family 4 protein [Bacteroidales bacterium]|jgi:hypothetical protein|nr:glycosyltransferase family 4 protein [Bacteroidales bacterium]